MFRVPQASNRAITTDVSVFLSDRVTLLRVQIIRTYVTQGYATNGRVSTT